MNYVCNETYCVDKGQDLSNRSEMILSILGYFNTRKEIRSQCVKKVRQHAIKALQQCSRHLRCIVRRMQFAILDEAFAAGEHCTVK